ncbi:hypothetical protein GCM10009678_94740 [Actinomadura kijaniata]
MPKYEWYIRSCSAVPDRSPSMRVVRVLIGDLAEEELVHVTRPVPPAELPDESILREVIDGLRAL